MTRRRSIGIVTGTRAEYGLLQRLMREIAADADLELQVFVTGAHLSPEFGSTYREIEADGFTIDARVEMLLSSDSGAGIAKSMGLGTIGFADALARLKPDILVVLGDRYEVLAAAQAAVVAGIPVAHVHGGETTEGAYDESLRHAITKLAQYHFVAAEPYRKRVVQLGEAPDRVFNLGAPGLDQLQHVEWLDRRALEPAIGLSLDATTFLVTYHPATRGRLSPAAAMDELLAALDDFPRANVVFTYPNADTGGRGLIDQVNRWVEANPARARAFASLGHKRYLSLMRQADVIIGNSSSGLTEGPALKKATVDIGDRQHGRLRATSVIAAAEDREGIVAAITKALSSEFQAALPSTVSLYGSGDVSRRIKATLKTVELQTRKAFFDVDHSY